MFPITVATSIPMDDPPGLIETPSTRFPSIFNISALVKRICYIPCLHDGPCNAGGAPVNILPDDVLLQIFDFDRVNNHHPFYSLLPWRRLVRVCRRWRFVGFASSNSLYLRPVCCSLQSRDMHGAPRYLTALAYLS
jgi:hypothetical protein